ncbi:MAG TPA: VOC family protein [Candidatus Binataceae bacterium]|jgi:catechol 2,3-dioxygenase-like lactoylglutathione lyase family enzyme
MIKRLDHLEVVTADLTDAVSIYERNFDFKVIRSVDGNGASVRIGDSEILLVSGNPAAEIIANSGEGMFALWLEAADVESVAAALRKSGIDPGTIQKEQGRRILTIDPRHANQVPLFIFDRKA